MRLNLILPKVEPDEFETPKKCQQKGCSGKRFIPRQEVSKKIVDAEHPEVTAWRYECAKLWVCLQGLPQGGEPQANLKAREWDGSDDVPAGAELWGCGNCTE
jgi:hypothetical protein